MATGYVTFRSRTAFSTLPRSCSNENSGVCTPITVRPASLYFAAQLFTYGKGRSELMHVYVQKSTRTTLPRSDLPFNGAELSQPMSPPRSGMDPSSPSAGCGSALPVNPVNMPAAPIITNTPSRFRTQVEVEKEKNRFMINASLLFLFCPVGS